MDRGVFLKHKSREHSTKGIYIRQFIFGTEDGLIGGLGLITGVSVATLDPAIIIISGVALMLTQAVSMGTGTYLSIKSQREVYDRYLEKEKEEIRKVPRVEREEVRQIYYRHGFRGRELKNIADRITSNKRAWLSVMMAEMGVSKKGLEKPGLATLIMALSVMLGAFIPLMPHFFLASYSGIAASVVMTVIALFVFGAAKSVITKRSLIKSGLEMMVIGMGAAGVGYIIGDLLGTI